MKLKMPAREDASIDMAPMIDLVFLLLIFFMVASVASDAKVEVDIPMSSHAKVADNIQGRVVVSIDVDGKYFAYMNEMEDLDALVDLLSDEVERNPDLRVVIRADQRVVYEDCKKLMIACAEIGISDLIYAAFEE